MRSKIQTSEQEHLSFIEQARRTQIIECAIDVIADLGYAQASLAQIAKRLNISKGVISYHFKSKEALIRQVIMTVVIEGASFVQPYVESETTASGKLHTYISKSIEYIRTNPRFLGALLEIFTNFRTKDGKLQFDIITDHRPRADLERILRLGQENNEFRAFSVNVMAVAIQSSINGVLGQWVLQPDLDLETYRQELILLFDIATRKTATLAETHHASGGVS